MSPDLQKAIDLARLALALSRVDRVTKHEDGVRPETDSDHTVMLGLVALELSRNTDLRRASVAAYALVHDLVLEAKTGDVQTLTIDAAGKAAKVEREKVAMAELLAELGETSIGYRLRQYEEQKEPEARFIRLLDKVMPKLTHALNGAVAAKVFVDFDGFVAAHAKQHAELSAQYPEFPEILALLREAMNHAEDCWVCDVCGETAGWHTAKEPGSREVAVPGEVFMDGFGIVPCTEVPRRRRNGTP